MEITYLGHSSFKLRGRGGVLVTDPFDDSSVGIKFPKIEADIVTISHEHGDHNSASQILGTPIIVEGPGEYEIKGIKIIGISSFHDNENGKERGENTIYRIEVDGISIVHLGDLGHKLNDNSLEILDGVDLLMIPVGGYYTISAQIAAEVISQLDPKIVIPMHFRTTSHDKKIFAQLTEVALFLKEMGKEEIKPVPKLSVTRDKLPSELTVVVLE